MAFIKTLIHFFFLPFKLVSLLGLDKKCAEFVRNPNGVHPFNKLSIYSTARESLNKKKFNLNTSPGG